MRWLLSRWNVANIAAYLKLFQIKVRLAENLDFDPQPIYLFLPQIRKL